MTCNDSHSSFEVFTSPFSYIDGPECHNNEEVTYTELLPLQQPSNYQTDALYDDLIDKENDGSYLNPLVPVFTNVGLQDTAAVFYSLSALQDDRFAAKLATIEKPTYTPQPHYKSQDDEHPSEYSNEYSNDSNNSNEHSNSLSFTGDVNDIPEINTKDVAEKVLKELHKHNIAQHVFARCILARSQGTLSDLLRNPKPWHKMKNGRETFQKMLLWLQQDETQRMSKLIASTRNKPFKNTK